MKVPKRIEDLLIKCAKYNFLANKTQKDIEEWLIKQGVDIENDGFRDVFIDSIEIGNNSEYIIKYLNNLDLNDI